MHLQNVFQKMVMLVIYDGIENKNELTANLNCTVETFGLSEQSDWTAKNIMHTSDGKNSFDVYHKGVFFATISLHIPGGTNITNALAAIAASAFLPISAQHCINGLQHYTGTQRRFQYKGEKDGIIVIDDYAHHPTEIKAALAAAQNVKHNKTWCVFQPHTYSRTRFLFEEFSQSFTDADEVIVADIFAGPEKAMTAQLIANNLHNALHKTAYLHIMLAILPPLHNI